MWKILAIESAEMLIVFFFLSIPDGELILFNFFRVSLLEKLIFKAPADLT